jgi:predicted DNA-binding transcriptional regulator YafY
MSIQEKETSNSLYRQWQILSRLSTGKWMGTRELQEVLQREGIEISLRTIQRDLNQIAQRLSRVTKPYHKAGVGVQMPRFKAAAYDQLSSSHVYDG